ncbi:hypothetical protein CGZ90_04410 [Fictibacillus aquaticus]|uniref:Uncharacterized protein n=1 Tax=Fictibacillus aquaticus TaxID=2021314 RepID=A0A235FCU6_9BACL|nr:hypothetical protein CGZ90_04410 [Fictibacillus aquaticus]
MKVLGDLYNSMFHNPIETNVYVEHQIWSKIRANVPDGYKIPDKKMMDIIAKFIEEGTSSDLSKL